VCDSGESRGAAGGHGEQLGTTGHEGHGWWVEVEVEKSGAAVIYVLERV